MTKIVNIVKSFTADESGAFASEYAVFLILIAAALVLMITFLGEVIMGAVEQVATKINGGLEAAFAATPPP